MVQSPAFRGTRLQKIFSGGRRWWYGGGAFKLHAWGSNRMSVQPSSLPRGLRRDLLNRTVHLAIIQACFTSNLRRSNWKSTVQRFFKSTVMIVFIVQGESLHTTRGIYLVNEARSGCKLMLCSLILICVFKIPMVLGAAWTSVRLLSLCTHFFPKHIIFALELRDYSTLRGFTTDKCPC